MSPPLRKSDLSRQYGLSFFCFALCECVGNYWGSCGPEVGPVQSLVRRYGLEEFTGSHGIGHTRMATESVVDTYHSHPFTSGFDLSIVHNGQISNYYRIRAVLERRGMVFETHNDSEASAHYVHYQLLQGKSLEESLHKLLKDLDGTYTFLVATADKMALVRDKFAAKPAMIYESPSLP
jgi:methylamine---glutamate N-methyltransferase subunit A